MNGNQYYVYLLASKRNGTLYIGVTSDLVKRVHEHKNNLVEGFTKKYNVHKLVYYEATEDVNSAITREKKLKKWKRRWKIELIRLRRKPRALPVDECVDDVRIIHGLKYCCFGGFR